MHRGEKYCQHLNILTSLCILVTVWYILYDEKSRPRTWKVSHQEQSIFVVLSAHRFKGPIPPKLKLPFTLRKKVAFCIVKHVLGHNVEHCFLYASEFGNSNHTVIYTVLVNGNIEGFKAVQTNINILQHFNTDVVILALWILFKRRAKHNFN